jgi:hypothetical protein
MANKPSDVCPLGRIPGNFKHAGGSQASMANKPSDVCPLGRIPGNFDHAVVSKALKKKPRDVCSCGRAHSGFFLCRKTNMRSNGRMCPSWVTMAEDFHIKCYEMYEKQIKFPYHEHIIPSNFHRNFYEISKHVRDTVEIS